ncbi:uroporphyrinogen-III synthase-like [Manduca sexta]|uniref:uroporphyrinogen-III synthase-like n=1 Tax=Manduca sexta TaxID=7130 RepID=UPI00188ED86E|nr:uroporphyrinogen-III synthase-like [Manduca sexta]
MKKVVLFKCESEDYQKAFNDNNYETVFVEPLQFVFINTDQLTAKLLQKDYDGLILTSPRAIEALSKTWDPQKFVIWNTKRVYTVGEASCHKIKLLLGLEALGATSGNAENLSKIILKDNSENSSFLFPCGNLRSETIPSTLQASDITVDAVTVYETKENENLKMDLMKLNNSEGPCCMVFFSPSGCEYIHRQLQTFSNELKHLPHFAIGNSTAHKIENLGMEIAGVASKPKADSLVESVQKYFSDVEGS